MKFEKFAIENLSQENTKWRFFAMLCNKKPISWATNDLNKTTPEIYKYNSNRKTHAEIRCLRKAPKDRINGGVLYIWRIGRNGEIKPAKPCHICEAYIRAAGIKKMIYTYDARNYRIYYL